MHARRGEERIGYDGLKWLPTCKTCAVTYFAITDSGSNTVYTGAGRCNRRSYTEAFLWLAQQLLWLHL